jgi:hypothetical protein
MSTTMLFYTFLPVYCCMRHLAVALELLGWLLKDDGFASTDKSLLLFYAPCSKVNKSTRATVTVIFLLPL